MSSRRAVCTAGWRLIRGSAVLLALLECLLASGRGNAQAPPSASVSPGPSDAPSPTPFVAKMPPYSLACGALLLSPLTDSCGYESGDLLNMLLEQHEEVYIIPKEACGGACVEAVLGAIRSNSACKQLQDWLPHDTADLRPLLGKRYSRACADIWASQREEEGSEAEREACTVAWDACEFSLPRLIRDLPPSEVRPYLEDAVYKNWNCPRTCNSTYLSQLTSQGCVSHRLGFDSPTANASFVTIMQHAPAHRDRELPSDDQRTGEIMAALFDRDRGVRRVCELTVNPGDTEMTAVRFSVRGLQAVALPADGRRRQEYLTDALASTSGTLPRYVQVEAEADGGVLSLKLKGEVLLPAEERLKISVLEGRLVHDLPGLFPEGEGLAIASDAWLEVYETKTLSDVDQAHTVEWLSLSSASVGVAGAARALALCVAAYLLAVGRLGGVS